MCIWGALAMIVSAPLDDWWHNAYGLDVEILSPPHTVLAAGILAIQIGAMVTALARQNNAGEHAWPLQLLFVYAGGVFILNLATIGTEYITFPNDQHSTPFFLVSAGLFPFVLVGLSSSARLRWGATASAAVYMGVTVLLIWILQLFPAQPMLAPILRPVDRMVPPAFPLLLVLPALVVDLIMHRLPTGVGRLRRWGVAVGAGVLSMLVLGLAQWHFAEFLLGDGARNFFFAADQWDYNAAPGDWQYEFWSRPVTRAGLGWSAGIAAASASLGLWIGGWMRRVRR